MFKNIFSRSISRNLFNSLFTNEYTCYQNKVLQFSKNFKPNVPHRLVTSTPFSKKNIKYPIILYGSISAAVGHKVKFTEEKEENEQLQYAINKGIFLLQRNKVDKGVKQLYEALNLAKAQNNLDGILLINTVLAEIAVNNKQYEKGQQILIDAKELILKSGVSHEDPRVINIIINLGMTHEVLKNYDKAKEHYEYAYEVLEKQVKYQKDVDIDSKLLWSSLLRSYGKFLVTQSQQATDEEKTKLINTGLSYQAKGLDVWIEVHGKESEQIVVALNDLAFQHLNAGDLDTAISHLKEAVEIAEKLPKSVALPTAYSNLGVVYLSKGMYEESKIACEESYKKAREQSNSRAENDAKLCLTAIEKYVKGLVNAV